MVSVAERPNTFDDTIQEINLVLYPNMYTAVVILLVIFSVMLQACPSVPDVKVITSTRWKQKICIDDFLYTKQVTSKIESDDTASSDTTTARELLPPPWHG